MTNAPVHQQTFLVLVEGMQPALLAITHSRRVHSSSETDGTSLHVPYRPPWTTRPTRPGSSPFGPAGMSRCNYTHEPQDLTNTIVMVFIELLADDSSDNLLPLLLGGKPVGK